MANQPQEVQILHCKFCNGIFRCQFFDLAKVEYFVFYAVWIFETTLWQTTLNRHLASFMRHVTLVTRTALSALVTFCRSSTFTGSFTATDSFLFVYGTFCGPDFV